MKVVLLLTPALGLVVVMMTMVIWRAVLQSFGLHNFNGEDVLSLRHWVEMFGTRRYWNALTTSALIMLAIAYPRALWLRKPFAGSFLLSALIKAPYFVPRLVAVFLLLNVIAFHGIVDQALMWLGLTDRPIRLQNDRNGYGLIALQARRTLWIPNNSALVFEMVERPESAHHL